MHRIVGIVKEEGRESRSVVGWGAKQSPPSSNPHHSALKLLSTELHSISALCS